MTDESPETTFPVTEADDHVDAAPQAEAPEPYNVKYYFMVEVHENDAVVLRTSDLPPSVPGVQRYATTNDIIATCQRVATELNNGVIIDNVVGAVRNLLPAAQELAPSQADNLRSALAERGIELSIKD